jgi:hypothetical protein
MTKSLAGSGSLNPDSGPINGFAIKHLISSGKPSHAAGLKQIRAIQREGGRHEQNDKQA